MAVEGTVYQTCIDSTVKAGKKKGAEFVGGRSSVGRAPGCGPGRRGFESRRSPFIIP